MSDVTKAFLKVLALLYGLLNWIGFALGALIDGKMFQRPSATAIEKLRKGKTKEVVKFTSFYQPCFNTKKPYLIR